MEKKSDKIAQCVKLCCGISGQKKIQSLSSIKEVGLFWGELDDRVFAAARTKNFSMKNCLLTFLDSSFSI